MSIRSYIRKARECPGTGNRLLCVCVAVAGLSSTPSGTAGTPDSVDHVPGQLLVRLKPGVDPAEFAANHRKAGMVPGNLLWKDLRIWLMTFSPSAADARTILRDVRSDPAVELAQLNHYVKNREIPDDPEFGNQWALQNTGQTGGTIDADIDAPEAWDISQGGTISTGEQIVIAVVDNGFDLDHEDLMFFKNIHEIPGNGIDDDGNGYTDDYDGWNAYDNNGDLPEESHGTHVTGIVAAVGNNATGVSGVNWATSVLPVAATARSEALVVSAYEYIYFARLRYDQTGGKEGAFVVATNSSFGIDFAQPEDYPLWTLMYDAMGGLGILSCGATANLNIDVDVDGDMPTASPSDWLISVTNTTDDDWKSAGAAYGDTAIDLGAPGTSILSTYPNDVYTYLSGTSMSSPAVAGVLGLMFSAADSSLIESYRQDPANVSLQFKEWLLAGTDAVDSLAGITVTGGRLNAYGALMQMKLATAVGAEATLPSDISLEQNYPNPFNPRTEIRFSVPSGKEHAVSLQLFDVMGQHMETLIDGPLEPGDHSQTWDATGYPSGTYFYRLEVAGFAAVRKMILLK